MLDSWSSKLSVEFDWDSGGPGWDPWPVRTTTSPIPAAPEARQITSADPKSHMETDLRRCIWLCFAYRIVNLSSQVAKAKSYTVARQAPFLCRRLFRLICNRVLLHSVKWWDFEASHEGVFSSDNWGGNKMMREKVTFHNAWYLYRAHWL